MAAEEIVAAEHFGETEKCPFLVAQQILSGKWSLLVLCYLRNGALRFGELQRYIPEVTQATLTKTLRRLEEDGIITRTVYPVVPPHVEYELSEIGRLMIPVLDSLGEFGIRYLGYLDDGSQVCAEIEKGSCPCCQTAEK